MRTFLSAFLLVFCTLIILPSTAPAGVPVVSVDINDTRLLSQPAISKNNVAFIYDGDLWVAGIDGKNVRRLTTGEGVASNPVFSRDGTLIAFSAQYEGNLDVYVVPVQGGVPKRLTWHPGPDLVQDFTPDGSAVLFTSPRDMFNNTVVHTRFFTVPVAGGLEEPLPIPTAFKGSYSPDGVHIAYNPLWEAFNEWKHYRGGTHSEIWIYNIGDHAMRKIPQPESRCNDVDARWIGDTVYFRSDRNGEFNLFSFDRKTNAIKQLTHYIDYPVISLKTGGGQVIYEQAGYLYTFDPGRTQNAKLTIGVAADLTETRPRYVKGGQYIRDASISPSGARVAFEFRGEIITMPGEKGDPRNLTNTPAVHERSPAWSPDGKSIAYFSDESGEYELHIRNQDGKGDVRKFKIQGAGFYEDPVWSPDSSKIAFTDNSSTLFWLDLKTGVSRKVAAEFRFGPDKSRRVYHVWSPDGKWMAYTLTGNANITTVYVYSLDQDKSYQVTDGLSEVSEPAFDQSGKYIYFFGSTDAGPVKDWFALSTADMRLTRSLYLAVLRKGVPSPLAKESDEEKPVEKAVEKPVEKSAQKDEKQDQPSKPAEPFGIDFDGLTDRIVAIPVPAGDYSNLQAGNPGQIYYVATVDQKGTLHQYDINQRKDSVFMAADSYTLSEDKKKLLYSSQGGFGIVTTAAPPQPGQGKLDTDSIQVRIEPTQEWTQIFNEAWRINRDYFYAPNMHGLDWNAIKQKYAIFLPHLATRADLNRVMQWMFSELGVSHHGLGGGDFLRKPKTVPGGLLGADYSIENGRYRFKKVYGGLNWNPDLRSPLTEPGVEVKAADYLLAVQGKELRPPTNIYSVFENTAGNLVEITVGPNPDGSGSRTVSVVPIADEIGLRNRDWVEGNLKKVDEATGGRVAYVHVPNTAGAGHIYFKRYFFPQAYKEAIIVDDRYNGGGQAADYFIDILRRPLASYWAMRYGADLKNPAASIQGPKVVITNESAGSGGDYFPWMFRKFKLGKIVGKRTWGGTVGILGFPILMDGGGVTAPNFASWTPEDGWMIENEGVAPDVEVEQTPADVIGGRDPQLEKAIELVMEELKKSPPAKVQRPPYPVKTK